MPAPECKVLFSTQDSFEKLCVFEDGAIEYFITTDMASMARVDVAGHDVSGRYSFMIVVRFNDEDCRERKARLESDFIEIEDCSGKLAKLVTSKLENFESVRDYVEKVLSVIRELIIVPYPTL